MKKILTIIFIVVSTIIYSQQKTDTIEHKINVESLQYNHLKSDNILTTNLDKFKFTVKPYINSNITSILNTTTNDNFTKSDIDNYNYVYLMLYDIRIKYYMSKKWRIYQQTQFMGTGQNNYLIGLIRKF